MPAARCRILVPAFLSVALSPQFVRAIPPDNRDRDVAALAERIDQAMAAKWAARGIKPTREADDAEFLRRVYLDLVGRIPTVADTRDFLEDRAADKRSRLVERLLSHPQHVEHMTTVWRQMMMPQTNDRSVQFLSRSLEIWLRKQFRDNVPYDKMVRELLTAPIASPDRRSFPAENAEKPLPVAFYMMNESKAENLAASTSRLFLGIKIECAQCHDHPFAKWSKRQFWEYAAFFSGIQPFEPRFPSGSSIKEDPARRVIKVAGTDKEYEARFLDGGVPKWKDGTASRVTLADWITTGENPYFARNAVNRVWAHFFGIGLIDPVDERSPENPPSHPELLDELAVQFAAHGFDLKFLMRAITAGRTYQLSSAMTDPGQSDPRVFARMSLKGLTGEQLFDSLATATGYQTRLEQFDRNRLVAGRSEFIARFSNRSDKRTEYQTSILQALTLMNGTFTADTTNPSETKSPQQTLTLIAVQDAPFLDTPAKKVETLYLATVSRKPTKAESDRCVKYIEEGGPEHDSKKALSDVFWALLNSAEFFLNH
jgi:hypothetical protein